MRSRTGRRDARPLTKHEIDRRIECAMSEVAALCDEAARIDGCTRFTAFLRMILPLSTPGLAACAVILFIISWHELLIPLIVVNRPEAMTVPVILAGLVSDYFVFFTLMMAICLLGLLPTLALVLLLQKYVVRGLVAGADDFQTFLDRYGCTANNGQSQACGLPVAPTVPVDSGVFLGCDFGSTTAKAVAMCPKGELLFSCYTQSKGNPIEDAKAIMRKVRDAGFERIAGLAITGYGKDLLKDIVGADVGIVETVAHATAALHFHPDADVICDVGGCDVKIMLLRQGTVSDFRLNSQCSSGNGAFLQGVAERYNTPLEQYAELAFKARSVPKLAMGCGVFLQSDIVNQQRKGWSSEEIMASLAAVLPLNVWVYAGQLQNLAAAGKKFVLQGGTHRNLAVVKAQVDFIVGKVPGAEIVVHPYPGEAGAIGAALCALDWSRGGAATRFRGFDTIEALEYESTTNEHTTCKWCPVSCRRTFIDVVLPGAKGRPWSKVPLAEGRERVISGNTCPKGLLEDANEMRVVKARMEEVKRAHPNVAEMVREDAFRHARVPVEAEDRDT